MSVSPVSNLLSESLGYGVARHAAPHEASTPAGVARLAAPLLAASASLYCEVAGRAIRTVHWSDPHLAAGGVSDSLIQTLCESILDRGEAVSVADVRSDLRFRRDRASADASIAAFAGVAVLSSAHCPLGILAVVDAGPRAWTSEELALLASFAPAVAAVAERGALAIENERLATALVHSDSRHRRLVASCPLAIYGLDTEGHLIELNQAAADILGRSIGEVMGKSFLDLVAPEDVELARKAFDGTVSGRDAPTDIELRVVRPTGERRLVQITRAPTERDERIVGAQGIGRDITDERAREAQFRRVERMASVAPLLSGVCHELNNPLTSIKSFAELLLLDERPDDDREALQIVAREADRASRIVADLRVAARQSQEAATSRAPVDVNEVVRELLDLQRSSLAGVPLRVELAPDLPNAWAVRNQVEQVISHLLSNAVHAVRSLSPPGEVVVSTYRGDLGVVLQVADRGPGIRPEDLNRIFDPFWTTRVPGEGTGLGLSLVHGIVSDHGGRIRADSTLGSGATFSVDLPAVVGPAAMVDAGSSDTPTRLSLRVLVVDDEAPIRTSLSRYLERRGHSVATAAEGGEALELLGVPASAPAFDIIVADLRMPGLNGERFLARLRQRGDGLENRLIFITGDAEAPDVEAFLRDAAAPVVWKPFELADVAQVIEAHAGLSGS